MAAFLPSSQFSLHASTKAFPTKTSPSRRPRSVRQPNDTSHLSTVSSSSRIRTTNAKTCLTSSSNPNRTLPITIVSTPSNPYNPNHHCSHVNHSVYIRTSSPMKMMAAPDGYEPSDEDRADSSSDTPLQLTLEQQLLMKQYEAQIEEMSTAECQKLAIEVARQMMTKDNVLKGMLKDEKALEFIRSLQPPNPYDPEYNDDESDSSASGDDDKQPL